MMARRHQISAMIGDMDPGAGKAAAGAALMLAVDGLAFGGLLGGLLLLSTP
jgi:hypothetical protein